MLDLLLTVAVSLALTGLALVTFMRLAPRWGLLDQPGGRKQHARHTPLVGGLAIAVGLLPVMTLYPLAPTWVACWALGSLVLLLIGLADDLRDLAARHRFVFHLLAGLLLLPAGVVLTDVGNLLGTGELGLAWLSVPLTLFAVAAAINATNLIDGVDGLLGTVTVVPLVALLLLAWQAGLTVEATLAASLLAATGVFLLFNFPFPWATQAKVFLGDAGSTLLGFNLAFLLIDLAVKGVMAPVLALYLLALPLLDTAAVMYRRRVRGVSSATPGRDHLHHILLDAGFSTRTTVAVMGALSLLFAAGGLLALHLGVAESTLFGVFLLVLAGYLKLFRSAQTAAVALRRHLRGV